ncbi:plasmid maintenance protein (plasmid) [Borreliella lanei]
MINCSNNKKTIIYHNKVQHKLIALISTLSYLNNKNQKYTQKNILYI